MTDATERTSKDWVTHECHRIFEAEFERHMASFREIIRDELKKELHPRHNIHHITYDQDLSMRDNVKKGMSRSLGSMLMQAIIIGIIVSGALFINGVLQ